MVIESQNIPKRIRLVIYGCAAIFGVMLGTAIGEKIRTPEVPGDIKVLTHPIICAADQRLNGQMESGPGTHVTILRYEPMWGLFRGSWEVIDEYDVCL